MSAIRTSRRRKGSLLAALATTAMVAFGSQAWADSADDVTLDAGFAKYTIKHMELEGANLPAADLRDILQNLGKPDAADRLAKLDAASLTIPDLTMDQSLGAIHQLAHYHDIKLTDIHGGKVGSYSIAGSDTAGDMGNGMTVEGRIKRMGGTGLDLPALLRLFNQTSPDGTAPMTTIYATSFGDGLDFKMPQLEYSVGKVSIADIKGRPLKRSFADLMAHLPAQPKPGQKPSPEEQKAMMEFLTSMLDIYGAFSVGKMDMNDLKFVSRGDPALQLPAYSVSISHMVMEDYANSRIGTMSLEGIDVAPAEGKFHLGKFALKGFDFRESMTGMVEMMRKVADDPAAASTAGSLMRAPKIDGLSLSDLALNMPLPQQPADPSQPAEAGEPLDLTLANLDQNPVFDDKGQLKSYSGTIDHLTFNLPANIPNSDVLKAAGFARLDLSSKFDAAWDAQAQHLAISAATLEAAGLGKLTLSATADNVSADAFSTDQFVRQAAWLGVLVKSADIRIDNQKLLDMVIGSQAKQAGKSDDEAKSDLITAAAIGIPAVLGDSAASKALGDAVAKFLANPKSLHIEAQSKEGIGAGDMAAPDQILGKVDLKATANE